MSRFFVGQRVRIKWSITWPWLAGMEGIISGVADPSRCAKGHNCQWIVTPDGYESPALPDDDSALGYSIFGARNDQLEPITDSYELVSWESMRDLWVPENLREDA